MNTKKICFICFHESKEEKIKLHPCKHIFHFKCLKSLYKNNNKKCPICDKVYNISLTYLYSFKKIPIENGLFA